MCQERHSRETLAFVVKSYSLWLLKGILKEDDYNILHALNVY